jgi:hypothetical protein
MIRNGWLLGVGIAALSLAALGIVALRPQPGRWQVIMGESQGKEVIIFVDTATGRTYWRQPGEIGWNPLPSPK